MASTWPSTWSDVRGTSEFRVPLLPLTNSVTTDLTICHTEPRVLCLERKRRKQYTSPRVFVRINWANKCKTNLVLCFVHSGHWKEIPKLYLASAKLQVGYKNLFPPHHLRCSAYFSVPFYNPYRSNFCNTETKSAMPPAEEHWKFWV